MSRAKRVTITEIARECGVSAQTVSRVLNNRPDVSFATRELVEKAIANTGYQPSALARGLVSRRSNTLGVIVGGLGNVGVSQLLNGIVSQSQSAGYGLLLREIVDTTTPHIEPVINMLVSHQVEGIIFAMPSTDWTVALADEVTRQCPPAIFLKREPSPLHTTIGIDNEEAAYHAVQHLLALGRTRIAHITGPEPWLEARQRRKGWERGMKARGLSIVRKAQGDWTLNSGRAAFRSLLAEHPDTDAVFVSNDQMAFGVLREAAERGIRVPGDIAVIGFDGVAEGAFFSPSLTTVKQPLADIGATAVQRLLLEIDGDDDVTPGADIVMKTELVLRESAPASA